MLAMDNSMSWEQVRLIAASVLSPVLGYFTPTAGFIWSLVVMFGFNVFAGMRADGISVRNCDNFSMRKFRNALRELLLYAAIIYVVYITMTACGDNVASLTIIKSLTYVFNYVYLQNSLKNLIKAYPEKMGLRIIYHIIRLEFHRAVPSYWKPIIERIREEEKARDKETDGKH